MAKMYMKVTADKYRLPIAVADTKKELAKLLGVPLVDVSSSFCHHIGTYIVVDVPDEELE